jgi:hypothetical protein
MLITRWFDGWKTNTLIWVEVEEDEQRQQTR